MAITTLERAKRAFYRKRYNDVISLLEPEIIQYRDSFHFYYFLGLACLHTGDIGGATSYFQRARQIRMRDPNLLVAQAALYLRRGDTHQAVEYYLEALEYNPSHPIAKKSLDFIRTKGDSETIETLVETGKITRFYPRPKRGIVPVPVVIGFTVAVLVLFTWFAGPALTENVRAETERADLSSLTLASSERSDALDMGGSYRYVLTEKEVISAYAAAQRYFQGYRDNAAQVEINRILYSNASTAIKQKARMLMTYLAEPGFDSIKDKYSYATIETDPFLYIDCWVVWKGMATNVRTVSDSMDLDFLVGYDTRNTLEGIVPVHFTTAIPVDTDKPLEILAKVSEENGKIVLAGRSVFQSGKPAKN